MEPMFSLQLHTLQYKYVDDIYTPGNLRLEWYVGFACLSQRLHGFSALQVSDALPAQRI